MYFQVSVLLLFSAVAIQTLAVPLHARQAPNCTAIDDTGLKGDDLNLLTDLCERISMFMPPTNRPSWDQKR